MIELDEEPLVVVAAGCRQRGLALGKFQNRTNAKRPDSCEIFQAVTFKLSHSSVIQEVGIDDDAAHSSAAAKVALLTKDNPHIISERISNHANSSERLWW
jgi:hypothetical protein